MIKAQLRPRFGPDSCSHFISCSNHCKESDSVISFIGRDRSLVYMICIDVFLIIYSAIPIYLPLMLDVTDPPNLCC